MGLDIVSNDAKEIRESVADHANSGLGEMKVTLAKSEEEKDVITISYRDKQENSKSGNYTKEALLTYVREEKEAGKEIPAAIAEVADKVQVRLEKVELKHSLVDRENFVSIPEGTKYENWSVKNDEAIGEMHAAHSKIVSVRAAGKASDTSFTIATPEAIEAGDYPEKIKNMAKKLAQEAQSTDIYPWDIGNDNIPADPVRIVLQNKKSGDKDEVVRMFAGKYDHGIHTNTSRGYNDTILLTHSSNMQHAVPGIQTIPHIENGVKGVIPFNLGTTRTERESNPEKAKLYFGTPSPIMAERFLLELKELNLAQRDNAPKGISEEVLIAARQAVVPGQEALGAPNKPVNPAARVNAI